MAAPRIRSRFTWPRTRCTFAINGKVVRAIAKSALGGPTDGQAGLRINHNMDLHIDGYAVKK